ncbi:acyltransferase family protein [Maribacter polysaccharolyticus]|uniref:acyltransferase family protein n=1 Tax=Maribacter polysaccharolyticus TaxID=3020831 RepID=UPI00237EF2F3|nr:acyltransferase [Maribacter polysaccharolyticus]MDE3741477.1 acyltransferase [Maribacter polysaccharolyticus]
MINSRNYTLDLIRGVSAIIVMAGHLRIALFKDFSELDNAYGASLIAKGFYFITGLGHQAVMVFFVLSGYFVGGSIIKAKDNFRFKDYLIARLSRLWTPLFPILIGTLLIDYMTGSISQDIINGNHYMTLNSGPTVDYSSSFGTFISNLLFLQTIFTPVFGSNGPLWSLANEFWYYILFPLFMLVIGYIHGNWIKKIISFLVTFCIFSFISFDMIQGFFIWVMGVGVYFVAGKKLIVPKPWFIVSTLSLFVFALADSKFKFIGDTYGDYSDIMVGISFSMFLIGVIRLQLPDFKFLNLKKISFWISEVSYTLYISHFPLVLLIYGLFYSNNQLTFGIGNNIQFICWLILLLAQSTVLWYVFERNTPYVRNKLKILLKENFLGRLALFLRRSI